MSVPQCEFPPAHGADYGDPKAWAAMMEWQFIWLRTIAKVWEEYDLPEADRTFTKALVDPTTDLHQFFVDKFGYELNPQLLLAVELSNAPFDHAIQWNAVKKQWDVDETQNWHTKAHCNAMKFKKNNKGVLASFDDRAKEYPLVLKMKVPRPPVNQTQRAYDLALYADSGRTYPFTCC